MSIRLQPEKFSRFANGVISAVNPLSQPQSSVPHAINFLFDEEIDGAVSRKGLTEIGAGTAAYPVLGIHNHRGTNSFALCSVSDGTNADIYKSTGTTWTKSLQDDTKDLEVSFAQFLDTTIRVNGTDAVKSTTDASTWVTTGGNLDIDNMPNGTIVKVYKQRLQVISGSTVYISSTPLAHLSYDAQTVNFTIGAILTGGTSGATAVVLADTDAGTTGTLKLGSISGIFQNNETITDEDSGSATANGTSTFKISWISGNKENLQVDPQNGSNIIAVGITGGIEGIEIFFKDNGGYRYNGSFLDPKPFTTYGCTSKFSISEFNGGIGFANQEGYCFTDGSSVKIITNAIQNWWSAIPSAYLDNISTYANNKFLLISIGDITKKDSFGKSKTYSNVVLYKSLTSDNWSILSFAKEFRCFTKYFDSGNQEIWGGTDAGEVHEIFNGTSDDGTPIFFEIETPDIIGDNILSTKSISEYIGICGKCLKGAKVYMSKDDKMWGESIGGCEEDYTKLPIDKFSFNKCKFKLSNYQVGTPIVLREFTIPHIETTGDGGQVTIEQRYAK